MRSLKWYPAHNKHFARFVTAVINYYQLFYYLGLKKALKRERPEVLKEEEKIVGTLTFRRGAKEICLYK